MIQVWKILHGHDNVKEDTWFTRKKRVATVNTRLASSPFNIELKSARLDIKINSFSVRVVNGWNALPDAIKESSTLNSFKNAYDTYMATRG